MSATSLKPVIEKLESLFSSFNQKFYNGELQTPVITVSPDTTKGAYGWCTSWKAWSNLDPDSKTTDISQMSKADLDAMQNEGFYEINICAEHLARPFEQVAETLLHEMVHLYNLQIGVQDTSRNGTYHNKKFKEAAEQHGLDVGKDPKYGWTITTLDEDARAFVDSLQDKKFELHRKHLPKIPGLSKAKQSSRKYVCPMCGLIIRATKEVNVICGDCGCAFEEDSDAFQQFVNNAIGGLSAVASVSLEILNFLVNVADVVANNWGCISPIIGGVTAALMVYYGWQLAVKAIEAVNAGVKIALAVASYAHAAATGAEVTATAAATAAQYSLNTAFLASPVTWVVMGIIALIAVLLAVTNAIAQVTGATQSGVGIITGVIAVGGAFILNTIISLINSVITLGVSFWNMLANFAAAFGLIFNDPIAAIEVMFLSLFNFIVSIVSSAAGILDTIFGSDLQSAVQGFQDKIQAQINTTVENAGGDKPKTLDPSDYTMERISYGDAFSMGADFGDGVVGGISDFFSKTFNMDSIAPSVDLSDYTAGIGDGVKDIAGNTGAIKNSLDITDEDLKYLRDIAEQEVINRFTTAEVKIDMSGMNNNISNGMDLDGVVSVMAEGVAEAIDTAAEGVHE